MERKEVRLIILALFLCSAALLAGCAKKTDMTDCSSPNVTLNGSCCLDKNSNSVCDITESGLCGNEKCEESENCTTCWKDCGACKKIIYIYVPRNFTLSELTYDLNTAFRDGIRFRRDILNINNVTDFLYYEEPVTRYFADILGGKYAPRYNNKVVVLNDIINVNYYVNDSGSLLDYVNYTNWYLIHLTRNTETLSYENKRMTGKATEDYPSQPTGYDKEYRYKEWEFRNFTKSENILLNNITSVKENVIESVYASIDTYGVTYMTQRIEDRIDKDTSRFLEDHRTIEERRLSYMHTMNVRCARNLVVTLYNYEYNINNNLIDSVHVLEQVNINRQKLLRDVEKIETVCKKYSDKIFIY